MNEWLKNIAGYFLILSVAMAMLPDKKYEPYVKLFTGFVLLLLLLQPVLRIGSMDSYVESRVLEMVEEQESLEREIMKEKDDFLKLLEQEGETETEQIVEVEEIEVEVKFSEQVP